jgi:hypothetical protein
LTLTAELDAVRVELNARDNAIAKLESELGGVKQENKDQVLTIAELENKLIGAMAEIQVMGEVKQLPLFPPEPTPEPTPENIKSPAVKSEPESNPEEIDFTGTISRGELVEYILEKFPDSVFGKTMDFKRGCHSIRDAVRDKDKKAKGKEFSRLFYLEQDYGFKFVGKIGKENRFRLV